MFFANTDREKDDWIGQIGKAIITHSSMYVEEEDNEGKNDDTSENS